MKANEVSKLTGLPISTLRFYERKQLIPEQFLSRDENNYRVYEKEVLEYLQDVRMLLTLGFSIQELILLINESSHIEKKTMVMEKINYIQALEAKLEASKKFLEDLLEGKANFQTHCKS
ncbi:MerR family transcriptional regulator [Paenibacillus glycinis]|uniref:MerR family DNA-binding transcriptional regulator n=1 Tax=Paenibacillus glycinis TaxID=2697035 RepID=A0ABW9XR16_9BACL|nr:MerR family transcriptional regulator [Paenibacillus glycinis]NBD25097.1 MerR family DNA-binding transcriptional regulator [Paenibacillus glycinis]